MRPIFSLLIMFYWSVITNGQIINPIIAYPSSSQLSTLYVEQAAQVFVEDETHVITSISSPQPGTFTIDVPGKKNITINVSQGINNFNPGLKIAKNYKLTSMPVGMTLIGYKENSEPVYSKTQVDALLISVERKIDDTKLHLLEAVKTASKTSLNEIQQDEIMKRIQEDLTNQIKALQDRLADVRKELELIRNQIKK